MRAPRHHDAYLVLTEIPRQTSKRSRCALADARDGRGYDPDPFWCSGDLVGYGPRFRTEASNRVEDAGRFGG